MQTAFSISTEQILFRLLIQFAVIIVAARVVGGLFHRMGQVRTMGEIFAGIILGPSLFGSLLPGISMWLFPAASPTTPNIIPYFSHVALIFTLFLIGMEFDFREVPRFGRQVAAMAVTTLVAPLTVGALVATQLWTGSPQDSGFAVFCLFVGICTAITAIPIMGRVLMELNLSRTRVGVLSISTGATKDILTWFCLAAVIGMARPPISLLKLGTMMGSTLLLAIFMLTAGLALVRRLQARWPTRDGIPHPNLLVALLAILLLTAALTSEIGIFAIFGAFLTGVMVSNERELAHAVSSRLHDISIYFLLPLFFTFTGLRVDFSHSSITQLGWILVLSVGASLSNLLPIYALARRAELPARERIALATLLNMPGLMVLIVLNVGYDLGILRPDIFSVLVGAAMVRNLVVTPVLRRMMPAAPSASRVPGGLELRSSHAVGG